MNPVGQAGLLVSFPVAAGAIGSTIASIRRPGPRVVSGIQHFAAGVVIAAMAGELLPDLRHEGNLGWATAGSPPASRSSSPSRPTADAASTPSTRTARPRRWRGRPQGSRPQPVSRSVSWPRWPSTCSSAACSLGSARNSAPQGIILTIPLTLEILFLSLSLAAELTDRGLTPRQPALICSGLGVSTAVGAISAAALLGGVGSGCWPWSWPSARRNCSTWPSRNSSVETHKQSESALLSAMFFAGFLAIYVLAGLGG